MPMVLQVSANIIPATGFCHSTTTVHNITHERKDTHLHEHL